MFGDRGVMSDNIKCWVININDESGLDTFSNDKLLLVRMSSENKDELFPLHTRVAEKQKQRGAQRFIDFDTQELQQGIMQLECSFVTLATRVYEIEAVVADVLDRVQCGRQHRIHLVAQHEYKQSQENK